MPRFLLSLLACFFFLFSALSVKADSADEWNFKTPAAFSELSDGQDALFRETAEKAVTHGRLLRLYAPASMARQYRSGNRDAVTRQVLLCALKEEKEAIDQKGAELLARSIEGLFIGFSRVPRSRTDTPAEELENRKKALEKALEEGTPLLVDSLRTSRAYLYTYLIHYNMAERGPKAFMTTAMATAVVPVRSTVLFITVSSLLGQDDAEPHLEWVKETATTFAEMIHTQNSQKKSP